MNDNQRHILIVQVAATAKSNLYARHLAATCSVVLCLLTFPFSNSTAYAIFGPDNYYECLLDRLPGTANDAAAQQVMVGCRKDFPSDASPEKKAGILDPTARECAIKKGKNTPSNVAGRLIVFACFRLYEDR